MAVFIEFASIAVLAAAWMLLAILLGESHPGPWVVRCTGHTTTPSWRGCRTRDYFPPPRISQLAKLLSRLALEGIVSVVRTSVMARRPLTVALKVTGPHPDVRLISNTHFLLELTR